MKVNVSKILKNINFGCREKCILMMHQHMFSLHQTKKVSHTCKDKATIHKKSITN